MPLLQPGSRSPRIQARLAQAAANASAIEAAAAKAVAENATVDTLAVRKLNAIGDSFTIPSVVLTANDAGEITIAPHVRRYPDAAFPDVSIAGSMVPGAANDTLYAVYYDDNTLSDPNPAFFITTTIANGQAGAALGRHSLGTIKIPAAGGGSNTGGGYNPPGGGPIP